MGYSQNNEEEVILNYFEGFKGTLLDIGANDGKTFSNSLALINNGWSAFLYEPSPGAYKACKELHKDNNKVSVINKAVSNTNGKIIFYDCQDTLLSSMNLELVKSWKKPYIDIDVEVIPFSEIKCKPDFITIDAEGMDFIILKQIDLTNVQLICIEHGQKNKEAIKEYCTKFKMKLILENYENFIYGV